MVCVPWEGTAAVSIEASWRQYSAPPARPHSLASRLRVRISGFADTADAIKSGERVEPQRDPRRRRAMFPSLGHSPFAHPSLHSPNQLRDNVASEWNALATFIASAARGARWPARRCYRRCFIVACQRPMVAVSGQRTPRPADARNVTSSCHSPATFSRSWCGL